MSRTLSLIALSALLAAPAVAQTAPDAQQAPAAPEPAAQAAAETAAPAEGGDLSGTYVIDPGHSQIVFSYDHLGFSISHGMINGVTGSVTLSPRDLSAVDSDGQRLVMQGDFRVSVGSGQPETGVPVRSASFRIDQAIPIED